MPCHNPLQNSRWNNFRLQNSGSAQKCRLHPLFLFTAVQCHAMLVQNKILWYRVYLPKLVLFRFEGAIVVVCIKWSNPRSKQLLWVVPTDVLGFYMLTFTTQDAYNTFLLLRSAHLTVLTEVISIHQANSMPIFKSASISSSRLVGHKNFQITYHHRGCQ